MIYMIKFHLLDINYFKVNKSYQFVNVCAIIKLT